MQIQVETEEWDEVGKNKWKEEEVAQCDAVREEKWVLIETNNLPGRIKAGSSDSILFVAIITYGKQKQTEG